LNKAEKLPDSVSDNGRKRNLLRNSVIISFLMRLSALLYIKLQDGFFGGIFTAYERENKALNECAAAGYLERLDIGGRVIRPMKHRIAKSFETSFFLNHIKNWLRKMLSCQVKVYGLFLFSFALYSALVYIFREFFIQKGANGIDIGLIITLVLMVIASVALISSRHTLAQSLLNSPVTRFFLFKIVGFRRESLEKTEEHEGRYNIAFIAGLLFGCASYFFTPVMLLIGVAGLIAAYLVLLSPEFGVFAIVTALPFAPTMGLVAAVVYTAFCYFLKLIIGKRSLRFDLLDISVFAFMVLMFFGGFVALSRASIKPMLVYVVFMLSYFLVVNLIRSQEWVKRCINGAVFSCVIVSLYGLYQNFFGMVEQTWQDSNMFSNIEGRVVSTFSNPNVLAEYLIMLLPLILAMFIIASSPRSKLALAFAGAITAGCLIYTWSRGAWLGFLIGILVFLLMYSKNTLTALLFGALGVPFLPLILPSSIIQRFLSIGNLGDSSTSYRVNIWRGVVRMLKDYFSSGIGIGNDSFRLVYPLYALSGIETAPHAHNLYLQIFIEIGIVGLFVFLAVMFIYAQSSITLHVEERRPTKLISTAIFSGLLAVLAQGMTDYIWYNYRVFLMFWLMLGLGAAVRKVHRSTAAENLI
jgi:putative inorganic carbon (HCO3(-)) transporter